jgi:major membrane immunogen (membrane-anchored lipoprotein)
MTCRTLYVLLVVLLSMAACSRTSSDLDLSGAWMSQPVETQLGTTIETFCFSGDGSIFRVSESSAGTTKNRGTYKLVGDELTLHWPDTNSSATLKVTVHSGKLVLTADTGLVREYTRESGSCDAVGR